MTDSVNENEKPTGNKQFWAIVPAAGVGKRMQADRPKQYLEINNTTVLEHTLNRLLSVQLICGVVVSISEGDEYWPELNYQSSKPVLVAKGGAERSDSVLNALLKLENTCLKTNTGADSVWALVHDAARPCVRIEDIQRLIEEAAHNDNGGLLALPVRDTMKRDNQQGQVAQTVDREGLWHALTPQMFRLDLLLKALQYAQDNQLAITDDASAMEMAGYCPQLIEAHEDNIKITRAFDLQLATLYLQYQNS